MFLRSTRYLCNRTLGHFIAARSIQHNVKNDVKCQFTPVSIDVPWGKIEGKLWGSGQKQPILALHGWMDNAGSFDRLAPLLNNSSILAIDFPGNGLSSSLPRGVPYSDTMCLQIMRLITRHFNWERVKLLGHSLGGVFCHNYTRYQPEAVQFVIAMDWMPVLHWIPCNLQKQYQLLRDSLDQFIKLDEKIATEEPPSYSESVILKKWLGAGVFGALDPEVVRTLMIRGVRRKDDGSYIYTRDPRQAINGFFTSYMTEEMSELTGKIDCPYLSIENSRTPIPSAMKQLCQKNIVDVLARNNRDFKLVSLDGVHHMHMTEPEVVASVIRPFLNKYDV